MKFLHSVQRTLKNSLTYRGRSTREEYLWFCLFAVLATLLIAFLAFLIAGLSEAHFIPEQSAFVWLPLFWVLLLLLPISSLSVRRLHDLGLSGWWVSLLVLPYANLLVLNYGLGRFSFDQQYKLVMLFGVLSLGLQLLLALKRGAPTPNRFGPFSHPVAPVEAIPLRNSIDDAPEPLSSDNFYAKIGAELRSGQLDPETYARVAEQALSDTELKSAYVSMRLKQLQNQLPRALPDTDSPDDKHPQDVGNVYGTGSRYPWVALGAVAIAVSLTALFIYVRSESFEPTSDGFNVIRVGDYKEMSKEETSEVWDRFYELMATALLEFSDPILVQDDSLNLETRFTWVDAGYLEYGLIDSRIGFVNYTSLTCGFVDVPKESGGSDRTYYCQSALTFPVPCALGLNINYFDPPLFLPVWNDNCTGPVTPSDFRRRILKSRKVSRLYLEIETRDKIDAIRAGEARVSD